MKCKIKKGDNNMLHTHEQIRKKGIKEIYNENFQKYNTVIGIVIGCNSHGCYVRDLKSNKVVFYFGNGMRGDKVQLTVKKVDAEHEKVTCVLDSVLEYGDFAA